MNGRMKKRRKISQYQSQIIENSSTGKNGGENGDKKFLKVLKTP